MSESNKKNNERSHRSTSQIIGNLEEAMKKLREKEPVETVPEIENPNIADQLWNIVPHKLRNLFLLACVFGGGTLGGGSIMGIHQNQSPAAESSIQTNVILGEIKNSQDNMADLQKEHSKELHTQSLAQIQFNVEQKLHSQAIMTMKEDVAEIKSDVKENRNDIKNLK